MDEIIKNYYGKYLYPSLGELYRYMKEDKIDVTIAQRKSFLDKLEETQITKETKNKKATYGHIVALNQNQIWQLDIFDLSRYKTKNKNQLYILCSIDVFSCKAYCTAMKTKKITDLIQSLTEIFKMGIPQKITSDSDSSFLGKKFQALLKAHDVIHDTVPISDHASFSLVDRFARTIKTILTKIILKHSGDWHDYLDRVVNQYNNKPHASLADVASNDI